MYFQQFKLFLYSIVGSFWWFFLDQSQSIFHFCTIRKCWWLQHWLTYVDIVRQNLYGFKAVKDLAILRFNRKKQYGNNVVGVKLLNIPTGGPGPTAYLSVSRLTLTFNICRHPRSSPQDVWCAPISPDGKPTGIFRQIPRPIRKFDLKSDCVFAWIF